MKTATINELARTDDGRVFGLTFEVCTNKETIRNYFGFDDDEAASAAEDAMIRAILDAGFDCTTESNFHRWRGFFRGPAPVRFLLWEAELENVADDGEPEEWEVSKWLYIWGSGAGATDVPPDVIAKAEKLRDDIEAAATA